MSTFLRTTVTIAEVARVTTEGMRMLRDAQRRILDAQRRTTDRHSEPGVPRPERPDCSAAFAALPPDTRVGKDRWSDQLAVEFANGANNWCHSPTTQKWGTEPFIDRWTATEILTATRRLVSIANDLEALDDADAAAVAAANAAETARQVAESAAARGELDAISAPIRLAEIRAEIADAEARLTEIRAEIAGAEEEDGAEDEDEDEEE